ncbi:hypothetical protein [Emticicia sp. C21]|uniref:hypothetical protein n=1 Tax=Emticicia sp. C21 TaxID=2302915 RepID=UPI000E3537DD|nr:hypothetical protein [Emticicia sp. C21]RFS18050.1 hypothetical protein D0T08_02040 [Emticicia sp. C21]
MHEENRVNRDIKEYRFKRVVPQSFKIPPTQLESEKVTNMVGTFLSEGSNGFRIPTTKMSSKKVTNMEGTFLNDGCHNN